MNVQTPGGIGHNQPPLFDQDVLDGHVETVDEFLRASDIWVEKGEITTDADSELLTDQIAGLRGLFKAIDDSRKSFKKPHDDAGKAVQTAFTPLLKKVEKAAEPLKKMQGAFLAKKQTEAEESQREEQAKAQAELEAARAEAAKAEEQGGIAAQADAEERLEQAEAAQKEAAKEKKTQAKSSSGGTKAMSLRTVKTVKVTNIRVLFMHYQNHPKVAEVLQSLATTDVRAADVDETKIPGIEIKETKTAV